MDEKRVQHLIFLKSLLSGFGGNPNQAANANPAENTAGATVHHAPPSTQETSGNVGGTRPNDNKTEDPRWFAYYHHMPCLNPSCKSRGHPHPNCRCYSPKLGVFAEGGEVEHFCKSNKPHQPDCEYYADGGEVVPDEGSVKPPPSSSDEIVPDEGSIVSPSEKYGTTGQQIGATAEGVARGIIGPLAPVIESGLASVAPMMGMSGENFSKEAQAGRMTENPNLSKAGEYAGLAGSMFMPGLNVAKGANAIAHMIPASIPIAGKVGSFVLKNAIPSAIFQGSDEISKAMLGLGDPNDAVCPALSNIGAAGLFGLAGGAAIKGAGIAFGKGASSALKMAGAKSTDIQLGTDLQHFAGGIGEGVQANRDLAGNLPFGSMTGEFSATPAGKAGRGFMDWLSTPKNSLGKQITANATIGASLGYAEGGVKGGAMGALNGALLTVGGRAAAGAISKAGRYAAPAIIKALSNSEGEFLPTPSRILNYAKTVDQGAQQISGHINNLFQPGVQQFNKEDTADKVSKLKDYIFHNGINQNIQQQLYQDTQQQSQVPGYAEGGMVEPTPLQKGDVAPLLADHDPIAQHFPDHDSIMQAARVRVSNYLASQQPQQNAPKFAFDKKPNQASQEKQYNKALGLAVSPLSIMHKIQDGRLTTQDMGHFTSMYPELHGHLQKKITERITEAQMKGEKPNAKVRQSLSLFMGTPMTASLSQPMLAAVQATFASGQQQQQGQSPQKNKKSTSSLSKISQVYQTANEAREQRGQAAK